MTPKQATWSSIRPYLAGLDTPMPTAATSELASAVEVLSRQRGAREHARAKR